MKLISMTDFVLQLDVSTNKSSYENDFDKLIRYANFIKQPLTLGMFIPCDENNEIIIERHYQYFDNENEHQDYLKTFEIAKSKVLFNGFNSALNSENCQISVINNSFRASIIYEKYYPSQQEKVKKIEDLIPYNLDLAVSF